MVWFYLHTSPMSCSIMCSPLAARMLPMQPVLEWVISVRTVQSMQAERVREAGKKDDLRLPVIDQSNRRDGVSLPYWFIIPFCWAFGNGMTKVIGLWNFRRRGSTVTIGLTATLLPNNLATSSGWTGWAWKKRKVVICLYPGAAKINRNSSGDFDPRWQVLTFCPFSSGARPEPGDNFS